MIRKTALMAGVAGALMFAAPAIAQEAPQDAPAAPPAAEAAQPQTLTLTPGASVKSEDGSVLGTLEGARNAPDGSQELTVRGADGQVRAVALAGLRQDGADVVVAQTQADFNASPAVQADTTPAPSSQPPAVPEPVDPAQPDTTTDPMTPPDTAAPEPSEPLAEPQA
jgi:hypothetical protein